MDKKIITPKEKRVILENFTSLSTLQGISYLIPLVILPYLIRVIGPEKFGLIAFAQALIQYFMIFTDYGFSLTATRKISLCKDQKQASTIFSTVMTVKFILAFLSYLILLFLINAIPKFRHDWLLYVFSFGAVIGNTLFPVWLFQGAEKMKFITIINIIGGIIYTVSLFIFVKEPADYLLVPLLNSLFFIITGLLGLYIAFKEFDLEFVFQSYSNIREELKTGWEIFISIVAINTYTATRIFAVGLLTNNTLTGYYSIAEKITGVIQAFPLASLSQAIYPRISKIFAKSKRRALRLMHKVQHSTTLTYLLAIPVLFFLSPVIVKIACGKNYPEVVISLKLLLLSMFFISANAFKVQFLLVCGRPDIYSRIHVLAALLGLPLIFIFIHYFSYLGAAAATITIETIIFISTSQILYALTNNYRKPR
ncbi:MAG: flippase [Candidatus Omnitrophota bacterium]|jgi:PST family polysaccharide transporter|nr:flippase [Candidatus Omnitrophota bacterium]MDD5518277.1 flippase [Candidatus Omnitrophota bacterium]